MDINIKSKKTVLIAMDESIQSAVAAYLLKKQGLNCIAISFVFGQEDSDICLQPLMIKDIKKVKAIAKKIEVVHYAIDAREAFKDKVTDNLVASKLAGHSFSPQQLISKIIFDELVGKMQSLKADYVSSGHFARVIFNQSKRSYCLGVANDIAYDESSSLALLDQNHLKNLILPLCDIKYSGVKKIAKILGLESECLIQKRKDRLELTQTSSFNKLVEKTSALSLREKGDLIIYGEDGSLCEHEGVYHFYIGQNQIEVKGDTIIDKKLEVISVIPNRQSIYLSYNDELKTTHCQMSRVQINDGQDMSLPLKVYFHFENRKEKSEEKIKGKLYFKNGEQALLIIEKEQQGLLTAGEYLVFYDKRNEGGKVVASGEVKVSGFLYDGRIRTLPLTKQEKEMSPANKLAPLDTNLKF